MTGAGDSDADLRAMVTDVVDANRYLVLGTTEPDGRARVSPVFYTHDRYRRFYWVSAPDARHSVNIAHHPDVSIVIFDSTRAPGETQAVYLQAVAAEVGYADLERECTVAFRDVGSGARAFTPAELTGTARLRLYRATVHDYAVHIRGSDPVLGRGVDTRLSVPMPPADMEAQ